MKGRGGDNGGFMYKLIAILLITLVWTPFTYGEPATIEAKVDAIAESWIQSGRTPGMTVAVAQHGETLVMKGYGRADIEHDVPATADTNYRIGSITKCFTAVAIMQLAEQGKINLSDDIRDYISDYDTHGETITIQHLLNHTAGIHNYTDDPPGGKEQWRADHTHNQMRETFESKPLGFAPGAMWSYSNSGYYLLGMVIETVTGTTYESYLNERLFEPAKLTNTLYGGHAPIIPNRAEGYTAVRDGFQNADFISMTVPYSAGALRSTVGDLLKFQKALWDGTLLRHESLRTMLTPVPLEGDARHGYANGFMAGQLDGRRKIAHEGGIDGFGGQFAYYPDDELVIAVLINSEDAEPPKVERKIARAILGLPEPSPKKLELSEEEAAGLTGTYMTGDIGVHITEAKGRLHLKVDGFLPMPLALHKQSDTEFWLAVDPDVRTRFPAERPAQRIELQFGDMTLSVPRHAD